MRLTTACGITGVGEIYNATFGPVLCARMAEEVFTRQFEGEGPHHIEKLWRKTYGAGFTMRPDVTVMGVLSGLEMACWDSIGKAADQPVYPLLGGKVRDKLRSHTYPYPPAGDVYPDPNTPNVYNDPDLAAEAALVAVGQGFTAVKFDPAGPYTIYDGHQPRLVDLDLSELSASASARRSATAPTFCSAPTASSPSRGQSAWPGGSRPMIPCRSKNRCRPKTPTPRSCPMPVPWSAKRLDSRPDPPAPDGEQQRFASRCLSKERAAGSIAEPARC